MSSEIDIPYITQTVELGFLDLVADLVKRTGTWELVRDPHPVRSGCSCVLRNGAAVEFILEVEATWEPKG